MINIFFIRQGAPVNVLVRLHGVTMGFAVNLYTISKRDNSTKRPTGSGTSYSCVMKHGSGILRPSITLNLGLSNDPSQYNYAYIPAFERYYFIEEWYFEDALWTATLKVDVLATYKTEIGNSSLYVMRAAAESNGAITDLLYPAKTGCDFASDTKTNPWNSSSFIIGVVSENASMGSLKYYAVGSGQLAVICASLMDAESLITAANGFNLTDASQALQLSLVDPIQYIKTCVMLPVAYTDLVDLGASEQVKVFNFDVTVQGIVINPNTRVAKSFTFDIQKHPDTNSRGNYVNSAPFTNITLTIPPFGCIDIDTSVTCNASTLSVNVDIDPVTGKGVLVVSCNGIILNRLESQIGVPISLSSVTRDYVGAATSAAGAVGGAIGGFAAGGIGGAALGAASGIGNAIQSLMPRAQTVGSTGAFVSNRGQFKLDHQFFRPIADDNTHNGRPLCAVRQINTLSGYMIIQDGDVPINGTSTEDREIRAYLEGGFYYE